MYFGSVYLTTNVWIMFPQPWQIKDDSNSHSMRWFHSDVALFSDIMKLFWTLFKPKWYRIDEQGWWTTLCRYFHFAWRSSQLFHRQLYLLTEFQLKHSETLTEEDMLVSHCRFMVLWLWIMGELHMELNWQEHLHSTFTDLLFIAISSGIMFKKQNIQPDWRELGSHCSMPVWFEALSGGLITLQIMAVHTFPCQ